MVGLRSGYFQVSPTWKVRMALGAVRSLPPPKSPIERLPRRRKWLRAHVERVRSEVATENRLRSDGGVDGSFRRDGRRRFCTPGEFSPPVAVTADRSVGFFGADGVRSPRLRAWRVFIM
jgi:hypothetical protein